MYWLRRFTILLVIALCISFAAWYVPKALDPTEKGPEKRTADSRWVNSSPYWLDRQACRWLSVCGLHHLRKDPATRGDSDWDDQYWGELRKRGPAVEWAQEDVPQDKTSREEHTSHERRRILKEVPDYVMKHAPLVHLYSGEEFWPSDIREHVEHMSVYVNEEERNSSEPWSLNNLEKLNQEDGIVILRSNDDVESRPSWLHSHFNKPNDYPEEDPPPPEAPPAKPKMPPHGQGRLREPSTWFDVDKKHPLHRISDPTGRSFELRSKLSEPPPSTRGHKPDEDGFSKAPAVLILVDKGSGIIDAFWFFFYSYNLGQTVAGIRFGNHVGDWEHCMIRFENGKPRGVFFSEHEGGQAYAWEALEKREDRPVIYSAVGSHAMYAMPGAHPYILPFRMLKDVTDKGPLWDPSLNNYAYHYDYTLEDVDEMMVMMRSGAASPKTPPSLVPAAKNPSAPTSWFHFAGRWGDEVYSLADPRQWRLFGQYHYVRGPAGPKFKKLQRSQMCTRDDCEILYAIDPKGKWY